MKCAPRLVAARAEKRLMVAHPKYKSGEGIHADTPLSNKSVLALSRLAGGSQCRSRLARGVGDGTNFVRTESSNPVKNLRGAELKISTVSAYGSRAFASIGE